MGWVKTEKTNKLSKLGDIDFTTTAPADGNALVYDETNNVWVPGEGGGGNANEMVLTQDEYDALTPEEQLNGTNYYINDASVGAQSAAGTPYDNSLSNLLATDVQDAIDELAIKVESNEHHYSTTEQVVGTWIDGSPVYEKTQYISALPSSTGDWVNYPHGISNFDRLISVSATAYNSGIPQQLNIPHVNAMEGTPTMVGQIAISVSETNIAFIVGNDRSSWEAYVTIRYTKSST